jgi:hypothetical protein
MEVEQMKKSVKVTLVVLVALVALGLTAHVAVNYVVPFVMKMHGY